MLKNIPIIILFYIIIKIYIYIYIVNHRFFVRFFFLTYG